MTSYSTTSSDTNTREHTHARKQAGRWRSSESARHEDTHRHRNTHGQIPLPSHTNTQKDVLSAHTILAPTTTLIALDIFSFSRGHVPTLGSRPADTDVILGHPRYSPPMLCSSLTFLLLGRRCIWPGRPCARGRGFWGSTWDD